MIESNNQMPNAKAGSQIMSSNQSKNAGSLDIRNHKDFDKFMEDYISKEECGKKFGSKDKCGNTIPCKKPAANKSPAPVKSFMSRFCCAGNSKTVSPLIATDPLSPLVIIIFFFMKHAFVINRMGVDRDTTPHD